MEKQRKREIIMNTNWDLNKKWELQFPDEILQIILSKLPFPNLPNCRLVCKSWNNLVSTRKFHPSNLFFAHTLSPPNLHCVDLDPKHWEGINSVASFDFRPRFIYSSISVLNSCAGLLALLTARRTSLFSFSFFFGILNLMTNEYIEFPSSESKLKTLSGLKLPYKYVLGFSPKTKQYKMVRTSNVHDGFHRSTVLVEVLALFGTTYSQWTPVGFFSSFVIQTFPGAYFDGGVYWISKELHATAFRNVVYRLDIENDQLERISFPQNGGNYFLLRVMDATLYLTFCTGRMLSTYNVWKMEQDFSWNKVFVVSKPRKLCHPKHLPPTKRVYDLQPIKTCEDEKILFLLRGRDLIQYDPKTQKIETLTDQNVQRKKYVSGIHQIDSFHFNSLHNILAGKC